MAETEEAVRQEPFAVLYMDDDREMRNNARIFLKAYYPDVEFLEAENLEEAIAQIHRHRGYIAAMVDIQINGENHGLKLMNYIKENVLHRVVTIVYTSTKYTTEDFVAWIRAGAYGVVEKTEPDSMKRVCTIFFSSTLLSLLQQATSDQMTGLFNYRTLMKAAMIEFKKAAHAEFDDKRKSDEEKATGFSVIFADVNGLKAVNDNDGHFAGDIIIRRTAEILKNHARVGDILCRKGGDEFFVFCHTSDHDDAEKTVERLQQAFANQRVEVRAGEWRELTVSFGCAFIAHEQIREPYERLLERAVELANQKEREAKDELYGRA